MSNTKLSLVWLQSLGKKCILVKYFQQCGQRPLLTA